jgi:hypothetical protein
MLCIPNGGGGGGCGGGGSGDKKADVNILENLI